MNSYQNKRLLKMMLLFIAMLIVGLSLWYTNNLVNKLKAEELSRVKVWAEATRSIAGASISEDMDVSFELSVIKENNTIPVIVTLQDGSIIAQRNLDSLLENDKEYLKTKIIEMETQNEPLIIGTDEGQTITVYYENSILYDQLKLYPFAQLTIIGIFLVLSYLAFNYSRSSEQNQVWVGMSKETAHQLGTPISSLSAWMDLIKLNDGVISEEITNEINIDIRRLELITERFSKIGSEPILEPNNLVAVVSETVDYLQKRLSSRIKMHFDFEEENMVAKVNVPLFAWVIENITKNAADAMEGEGSLTFKLFRKDGLVALDISDTGKGISSSQFKTIFKPGFTTKKRGWGLGLSLVKRIVNNYHGGNIFVKESIPFKKTTFRILLKS
jgi:signal transduction histidine kinase